MDGWNEELIQETVRNYAEGIEIKLGKAAQPLRAAMTGKTVSPSIFEVMEFIGRDETLGRLEDALKGQK